MKLAEMTCPCCGETVWLYKNEAYPRDPYEYLLANPDEIMWVSTDGKQLIHTKEKPTNE